MNLTRHDPHQHDDHCRVLCDRKVHRITSIDRCNGGDFMGVVDEATGRFGVIYLGAIDWEAYSEAAVKMLKDYA